jgi:hypothetical protein
MLGRYKSVAVEIFRTKIKSVPSERYIDQKQP